MYLRRVFTLACIALGLLAGSAHAQLRQGQEFTLLNPPQPTVGGGKVEVIEFFSYACGHCYKLEPFLEIWSKNLPADVVFKRIPGVGSASWTQLALLFYSLEAMGKLEPLHHDAFDTIHRENTNLASSKSREQWLSKKGIDAAKYEAVEKSFTVQSKIARAAQLMGAYKIDGVPTIVVNGKYVTSSSQAGGPERVVAAIEQLVAMSRKEMGAAGAPAAAPQSAAPKK